MKVEGKEWAGGGALGATLAPPAHCAVSDWDYLHLWSVSQELGARVNPALPGSTASHQQGFLAAILKTRKKIYPMFGNPYSFHCGHIIQFHL